MQAPILFSPSLSVSPSAYPLKVAIKATYKHCAMVSAGNNARCMYASLVNALSVSVKPPYAIMQRQSSQNVDNL